jgi:hypothetical protein
VLALLTFTSLHLFNNLLTYATTPLSIGHGLSRRSQSRLPALQKTESKGTSSSCSRASTFLSAEPSSETYCQCDERRPKCLKCEKARRPCPGYRDLNQVIFRDDTARTVFKTRNALPEGVIKTRPPVNFPPSHSISDYNHRSKPPYQLSRPPSEDGSPPSNVSDEHATSLFLQKYIPDAPPLFTGFRDWLRSTYAGIMSDSPLSLSIRAAGQAAFANMSGATDTGERSASLLQQARSALDNAISRPDQAVRDETLISVIILGLLQV